MSIIVARIENLFWTNNASYKKPNALPEFKESKVIKRRPIIYDFMGGRTHLIGDQWNYAIYEGTYYFLKIDTTYDLKKGHFSYVLIRDLWMNIILKFTVGVKGRLIATKRDEWLSANLNRTYPILIDPVEVTRIKLIEEDYELTKHVNIRFPFVDLRMPYLSKKEIDEFKNDFLETANIYKNNFNNKHISNNKSPIYIFGYLKGNQSYVYSWKENLKKRLNDYLKDFKNQKGNIFISKVRDEWGSSMRLSGKYCLTWNVEGIGASKEVVQLSEIDLSSLTDIVPINMSSLEPLTARLAQPYMRDINESLFDGFRDFQYKKQDKFKIRRKIYFPFTQNIDECGMAIRTQGEDAPVLRDMVNWKFNCPQKLETDLGTLFLTYVNDINFSLDYNPGTMKDDFKYYLPNIKIDWPYPRHTWNDVRDTPFWKRNLRTDLGFLIFDLHNPSIFHGFKCVSDTPVKKIQYISGLKKSTLKKIKSGEIFTENFFDLPFWNNYSWFTYKDPIDQNWRRYWHNLTSGLEILLLPNQKQHPYAYRALNKDDRLSNNYSIRALQSSDDVWKGSSPFKDETEHLKSISRRNRLIKELTMRTLVEIPIELKSGDYLFNDLQFWIDQVDFNSKYTKGNEGVNRGFTTSAYDTNNLMFEDFLKDGGYIEDNLKQIAICNTEDGKLELRELHTFSLIHKLHGGVYSESLSETQTDIAESVDLFTGEATDAALGVDDLFLDEQGLYSVDQITSKRVGYLALKKIENGEITNLNEPLNERLLNIALNKFLALHGYLVSEITTTEKKSISKVLWYKDEDFEGVNPLLFDLKGTEWYLYIKKGRISLIAKTPDLFTKLIQKVQTIGKNEKLNKLSVIEKINQKCVLNVHTHERSLKTRFNFDHDKFALTVSSMKGTELRSPVNYFFLALRGDFDVIEKDIISVPKSQLESGDVSNHLELEKLRIQMLRSDRDYEIKMEKNIGFQTEKMNEEFRRRKWDLEVNRYKTWFNGILNIVTGGLIGAADAMDQFNPTSQASSSSFSFGRMAGFVAATAGLAKNISNLIVAQKTLNERDRRLVTDRKFAFRNLVYESLDISLSHRDFQEDSIRALNETVHLYQKGTLNNEYLMSEFRKEIGFENTNTYLTVFTPSKEQLKILEAHKEEFGVDCDIPCAIIEIKEGMPEEIIQFKNLDDTGVVGLPNLLEREYLIGILEKGLKVVDVRTNPTEDFNEYVCTNIKQLSRELEQRRIQSLKDEVRSGELIRKINSLEAELAQRTTLTAEQIAKKEAELANTKNELARLNKDNEEKNKKVKELADKLELLDRQIKEKSSEYESKNNEYLNAIEEVKNLNNKLKELQESSDNYKKLLEAEQADKAKKQKELEQLEEIKKQSEENKKLSENYKKLWDEETKVKEQIEKELNKCKDDAAKHEEKIKESIIATEKAFDERIKGKDKEISDLTSKTKEKDDRISSLEKQLKAAQELAKGVNPFAGVNTCDLVRKLVKSSDYSLDLKIRDNGFSAFTDLAFYLGDAIHRMRTSSIDFHLNHYEFMRPIFEKLYALEQIPTIDKAESIVQMQGYSSFVKWLKDGGDKNGNVDKVISETNTLKSDLVDMPKVHSVWSLLDELNYLVYKARQNNQQTINDDSDLDFFFKHIYPGQQLNDLYKALFELEAEFAVTKKKFLLTTCVPEGEGDNPIVWIDKTHKQTDISVPRSSMRPDGLPPTTATLRMPNNDEYVLDETFVFPYFFPTNKGIKRTYKYINPEGVTLFHSFSDKAFFGAGLKKFNYTRESKKWSWEVFTTTFFYSASLGKEGRSDLNYPQEVYIRARQTNIFKLVHSNRKQHWRNKNKIQVPDALKEAIKNKQPFWKYVYVRNWEDFEGDITKEYFWSPWTGYTDRPLTIDLVKVFGKRADDAYRLLGILDVAKWWFDSYEERSDQMKRKYDSLPAIEFFYRIFPTDDSTYTNTGNDFYTRLNRNNIITDEFLNLFSLINYVWYHIKNPGVELKSVFEFGTSCKNIDELCNMVNNWKIRTD